MNKQQQKHKTRQLYKQKDTAVERNIAGAFLYALIEFCPSEAWYQFELLSVWQDCSHCLETEQTPTRINTHTHTHTHHHHGHTQKSFIIQTPRLTTDTQEIMTD